METCIKCRGSIDPSKKFALDNIGRTYHINCFIEAFSKDIVTAKCDKCEKLKADNEKLKDLLRRSRELIKELESKKSEIIVGEGDNAVKLSQNIKKNEETQ